MSKRQPKFTIESYGVYHDFSHGGKSLPKIKQRSLVIPAELDVEFGLILRASFAKGETLRWRIEHPNIHDKKGRPMAPFEGEEHIRTNDWQFYLGDTCWAPVEDKTGDWAMFIEFKGEIVAQLCFELTLDNDDERKQAAFWKSRGF